MDRAYPDNEPHRWGYRQTVASMGLSLDSRIDGVTVRQSHRRGYLQTVVTS